MNKYILHTGTFYGNLKFEKPALLMTSTHAGSKVLLVALAAECLAAGPAGRW